MINKNAKIYIAGHNGMVGNAIVNLLIKEGYFNLIKASKLELDLIDRPQVDIFFALHKPEYVIITAAKVGGINANILYPVEFLLDNIYIQNNLFYCCNKYKVKKVVFLGSSCIYPKECPQPIKEEYLLNGKLEPTNEGYALAKITGLKLAEYYKLQYGLNTISLMPCNLYGPNDSFDLINSHVLSALVKKICDAVDSNEKKILLWGTGNAKREFMHVDDLAIAVLFFLNNYDEPGFINIGWGIDITIKDLANKIASLTGFNGEIHWDISKPDGMMRKCLDVTKMKILGYSPLIQLEEGITQMIEIYKKQNNI
jgi:GDP-L-fucose synthase